MCPVKPLFPLMCTFSINFSFILLASTTCATQLALQSSRISIFFIRAVLYSRPFPRPHTYAEIMRLRFKSSLTCIIIESTYLTLNMKKIWGCFKVQVGWKKCILWGNWVSKKSRKGIGETLTIKKTFFNLHFKCQEINNLSVFNVQIIRL